jgi:hypothetical protein
MTSFFGFRKNSKENVRYADSIIDSALTKLRELSSKIDSEEIKYEGQARIITLGENGTSSSKITKPDFESSLSYLNKEETRDQLNKIIIDLKINGDAMIEIKETLGLVFCEIIAIAKGFI